MNIKQIEESYGFRISSMESIRSIYKITTDRGEKCLKKAHMSPSNFSFLNSVIEYLLKKGFKNVIPYNKTLDGSICVSEDKYIYYVMDWIEAREARFKQADELKAIIKTAAEFHKASEGYTVLENTSPRIWYGKWPEKFEKKRRELLAFRQCIEEKEVSDEFDEIYTKDLTFYWEQGKESIEKLKQSAYEDISNKSKLRGDICHHDMANHNFLITPQNNVFIIDFDYCILDTRLHDISSLVIRNMRYGVWDLTRAYNILSEYDKWYTISRNELEVIKAFMTFPQDFWQIGLQYYIEKQPWTMELFLTRLNRIVDDKDKRLKFLNEFLRL